MRGTVEGLASPHPLAATLPAMLREDPFAVELCGALDEVLAPVLLSLDGFAAHLDPALAPDDGLGWLSGWVGVAPGPADDPGAARAALLAAAEANALRGTRKGLELVLRSGLGMAVEVRETGVATWSSEPGGPLPGEPGPVVVVLRAPAGAVVDLHRAEELVRGSVPAHVRSSVVVEQAPPAPEPDR